MSRAVGGCRWEGHVNDGDGRVVVDDTDHIGGHSQCLRPRNFYNLIYRERCKEKRQTMGLIPPSNPRGWSVTSTLKSYLTRDNSSFVMSHITSTDNIILREDRGWKPLLFVPSRVVSRTSLPRLGTHMSVKASRRKGQMRPIRDSRQISGQRIRFLQMQHHLLRISTSQQPPRIYQTNAHKPHAPGHGSCVDIKHPTTNFPLRNAHNSKVKLHHGIQDPY